MTPNLNDKYYLRKELEKEEKQSQRELAKMENFAKNDQKMQYRYILTHEGIKEKIQVTGAFIQRKEAE